MRRLTPEHLHSEARPLLIGEAAPAHAASAPSPDGGIAGATSAASKQFEAAFADAQARGLAEGRAKAEADYAARLKALETRARDHEDTALARLDEQRRQLAQLMSSLDAAVAKHAEDCEELAVEVAYAALVRVLGDAAAERSLIPDICRTIVREYGHPSATLRVSDLDMPLLEGIALGVPVEADRRLARGEAVIDTARGQFECGLDVRLGAIAEALAGTLAAHRSGA